MLSKLRCLFAGFALVSMAGCVAFTLPEAEVSALADVPPERVLVVGKITLNPPLRESEKELNIPNDLFDMEEMMSNRAIMGFSANANIALEKAGFLINPVVGETFFFSVPRNRVNMVGGYITVSYSISAVDAYNSVLNHGKVLIPSFQLKLQASDKIVYIGTLHLQRGPFNEVTNAGIIDEYDNAIDALSSRFGLNTMRKALPKG